MCDTDRLYRDIAVARKVLMRAELLKNKIKNRTELLSVPSTVEVSIDSIEGRNGNEADIFSGARLFTTRPGFSNLMSYPPDIESLPTNYVHSGGPTYCTP